MNVEAVIREYITKTFHLSLATAADSRPWVSELHFVYDDALNLYVRSKPSRRHSQEIAVNPQVAGNIVRQHELTDIPEAIYFEGHAEQLTDELQLPVVAQLFMDAFGLNESIIAEAAEPDGAKFYKITVSTWYAFGKFDGERVEKHELAWHAAL